MTLPQRPALLQCPPPDAYLSPVGPVRPPEFKEYASVWLLDSGKTEMYDQRLLDYPDCLVFLVRRLAASGAARILVVYDRRAKTELLVIRNYD